MDTLPPLALPESYCRVARIDTNHAEFIRSLVMCHKPRSVLELGFGAGESCRAIRAGLAYNGIAADYTLVDNWLDFGGQPPALLAQPEFAGIEVVTSGEYEFFQRNQRRYDFIFSDADHFNTQRWFDHVHDQVLERGGVLVYHDVTNVRHFPNLMDIYRDVLAKRLNHVLLNRNSRTDENCDRGLLVLFKG